MIICYNEESNFSSVSIEFWKKVITGNLIPILAYDDMNLSSQMIGYTELWKSFHLYKVHRSELSDCIIKSLLELCPSWRGYPLSVGLGVHQDATRLLGLLGVREYGNLASTGGAGVRTKLISEFACVFCLNTGCDRWSMLVVASSTTVLDENEVSRGLLSTELRLLWLSKTHLCFFYYFKL